MIDPADVRWIWLTHPDRDRTGRLFDLLDVGDPVLSGLRPPLFDSPATVGVTDHRTGALFSSDCFGAPLRAEDAAAAPDVREASPDDLRAGQLLWAGVDSPWVRTVDQAALEAMLAQVEPPTPVGA